MVELEGSIVFKYRYQRLALATHPELRPTRLRSKPSVRYFCETGHAGVDRPAEAAVPDRAAGTNFLPGTDVEIAELDAARSARLLNCRQGDRPFRLSARVVLMATGLSGEPIRSETKLRCHQSSHARIGLQTFTTNNQQILQPGTIYMAVGRHGYVGLTVVEEERLNVAAAVDVAAVRESNAEAVCRQILIESGLPLAETLLDRTDWQGTVGLTRQRGHRAAERVFVIGDAAGYVEPFTGEGMASAIRGGQAVCPFVEKALHDWEPQLIEQWNRTSKRLVAPRETRSVADGPNALESLPDCP